MAKIKPSPEVIQARLEKKREYQKLLKRRFMLDPAYRAFHAARLKALRKRQMAANPDFYHARENAQRLRNYYKHYKIPTRIIDRKKEALNRMGERQTRKRNSAIRFYIMWWKRTLNSRDRAERFRETKRQQYISWWNRQIEYEYSSWWKSALPHPLAKDPIEMRLKKQVRGRLKSKLQQKSGIKTIQLIGCSLNFLRSHLERQFKRGMTWQNYGSKWHIDHIIPLSKFNLRDPNQQMAACHYSNLQPLDAWTNCAIKGDTISIPLQPELNLHLKPHPNSVSPSQPSPQKPN